MEKSKKEFIELISETCKLNGFDELTSRIIAHLYIEPKEVSLKEISEKTGYSLSAISTSTKFLEKAGVLKKIKKPRSKQVFFYVEKDINELVGNVIKNKYEKMILPLKESLPKTIEEYQKEKTDNKKKEELKIIKRFHKQIMSAEKSISDLLTKLRKNSK